MNPPDHPTPRTDAECIQIYQEDVTGCSNAIDYVPASVARTLERELTAAQAECDLNRNRLASILWSGAIDKQLCGDVQQWADDYTAELARLRADLERFTGHGLLDCHAICDQRDAAVAERDRLRAEVERLKALGSWVHTCIHHTDAERANAVCPCCAIARAEKAEAAFADPHALHAHCLRTLTEGQIAHLFGERMTEIVNRAEKAEDRAEKAEAALADWSVLKAWGGTPEIIHQFVKGQQNRIHHCQDLEAILNEETNRAEKVEADNARWQKLLLMSRDDREIDLISEVEEQARFLSMSGEREANLLSALKLMVVRFDAYIDSEYCGTDLLAEHLAQADFAREVIRVSDLRKKEMQILTDQ
jgi:hypothetical protein